MADDYHHHHLGYLFRRCHFHPQDLENQERTLLGAL